MSKDKQKFYIVGNGMYLGEFDKMYYDTEKAKVFTEEEIKLKVGDMSLKNPSLYFYSVEVENPEVRISGEAEDKIYAAKKFNNELQKVMDERYEALKKDLNLPSELEDFLFDHVYNDNKEQMFEEYLAKYGKKFEKYIV